MNISVYRFDNNKQEIFSPDEYSIMLIKGGFSSVSIDFEKFTTPSNSIWFITPGKHVTLEYDGAPVGWILRFTKKVFSYAIRESLIIKDVELFRSFGTVPKIILSPKISKRVHSITEMIDEFIGSEIPNKESAVTSLLETLLIYCDSKCNIRITEENNVGKIQHVTTFKDLVEKHVRSKHKVAEYAKMMNISSKYLNQVVKEVLGVTAKSVIMEQIIIMARRELKFSDQSIKEIAFKIGFTEPFHFSNYFKKQMGCSPSEYRLQ